MGYYNTITINASLLNSYKALHLCNTERQTPTAYR